MATTPYDIKIAPTAAQQMKALSVKQRKMIVQYIEALSVNPRPPGARKIEGMMGLYSESIHQFKLIYKVEEQEVLVLVLK